MRLGGVCTPYIQDGLHIEVLSSSHMAVQRRIERVTNGTVLASADYMQLSRLGRSALQMDILDIPDSLHEYDVILPTRTGAQPPRHA